MDFRILIKIILPLFFALLFSVAASAAPRCESLFLKPISARARLSAALNVPTPTLSEMLLQLKIEKKLIYQGDHHYSKGHDFLASNEFDWLGTPFDHKPADVMVGFGTNSAWDIAVNKDVKRMYLMDWSPNPILAQAYLVAPLMKIAKTPEEFLVLLSGRVLTKENLSGNLKEIFNDSLEHTGNGGWKKAEATHKFLEFLAGRDEISNFELRFLTSYYQALNERVQKYEHQLGPFKDLRNYTFGRVISFYSDRYNPQVSNSMHYGASKIYDLEEVSVFSSKDKFEKLRNMYARGDVKYAIAGITDQKAYQAVLEHESVKQRFVFSLTNIFDAGIHNGLNMSHLEVYLKNLTKMFSSSLQNPLVVFRTQGMKSPHNYVRYDLDSPAAVDRLDLQGAQDASKTAR